MGFLARMWLVDTGDSRALASATSTSLQQHLWCVTHRPKHPHARPQGAGASCTAALTQGDAPAITWACRLAMQRALPASEHASAAMRGLWCLQPGARSPHPLKLVAGALVCGGVPACCRRLSCVGKQGEQLSALTLACMIRSVSWPPVPHAAPASAQA
jgi:hypothetical protein